MWIIRSGMYQLLSFSIRIQHIKFINASLSLCLDLDQEYAWNLAVTELRMAAMMYTYIPTQLKIPYKSTLIHFMYLTPRRYVW